MPDVNDLHRFYEANLPGYQRRDLVVVTKFFVDQIGGNDKKPLKSALKNWKRFQTFVCVDWQGMEVRAPGKKIQDEPPAVKHDDYGPCPCGGRMVKRQNRAKLNFFLGCSRWPKCKNTQTLDE